MDTMQRYRAMLGVCRQRAQMEGENVSFWLEEAAVLEQLLANAVRMEQLKIRQPKQAKHNAEAKGKNPSL